MSAFIVDKKHIDLMVNGIVKGTSDGVVKPARKNPDRLGQMLIGECVASVSARYPNASRNGGLPGPVYEYYLKPYEFEDPKYRPTSAELYKAIDCYSYQSCEHDAWAGSAAAKLCDRVRAVIAKAKKSGDYPTSVAHRAEYDAAPWSYDETAVAVCFAKSLPDGRAMLRHLVENRGDLAAVAAFSDWLQERGLIAEPIEAGGPFAYAIDRVSLVEPK